MPFGMCPASEVLQKGVYKVFGYMQGVQVIADDMIIAGATEEEHDQVLRNVMQRATEQNVNLIQRKFTFCYAKSKRTKREFNSKKVQFKQHESSTSEPLSVKITQSQSHVEIIPVNK